MLAERIFLQLAVIILIVQLLGSACRMFNQQWVIGEILAGIVLGPSLLGAFLPNIIHQVFPVDAYSTLQTLGDVGLSLYMFSLGARLDVNLMLGQSRNALIVSASCIVIPLISGFLVGGFLYPAFAGSKASSFSFQLLLGIAIATTAFPVLARLLTEKKMLRTKIGILALTSASIDDVIVWCLLAFVLSVIQARSSLSAVITVGWMLLFVGVMFLVVRPFLHYAMRHRPFKEMPIVLGIIVLMLSAYMASAIGIHPVFGAFLAGIILPRHVTLTEKMHAIDQVNNLIFLPLFFVCSGLRTQIGLIQGSLLWLICLLLFFTACSSKILSGALPARFLGFSWKNAFSLGLLMNTRGLVELIVLNIGLEWGVLSPTMFAMLVIVAIVTTAMVSPLLPFFGYGKAAIEARQEKELSSLEI